jgi:hypothetical protein
MHNISDSTIKKIFRYQLDIPTYKVKYALLTGLLRGMFESLIHYGIELNERSFNIFYDAVSEKLAGTAEIEYEFTEKEYDAIMCIRSYCL